VLIVDLDPQSSASLWIGDEGAQEGLLEALLEERDLTPLATGTRAPWVSIVPSSLALSEAEHLLAVRDNGMLALRKCVEKIPPIWDYILLDCPPTIGALALNGLGAADWVMAPIEDSPLAFSAAPYQEQIVATVRQRMNPGLRLLGYLLCRSRNSKARRQESIEQLSRLTHSPVIELAIRKNKIFAEASAAGRPVCVHAPKSTGAKDYFRLARWTLDATKGGGTDDGHVE
jgi:chromosome partitioning protein